MSGKLSVAVVGLGFGEAFVPIYRDHPEVAEVSICDANPDAAARVGERFGISRRFGSLDEVLEDGSIDAVHLLTPVPLHAQQSLQILEAGKHCACAVPMATDLDDLRKIIQATRTHGRKYMLMETAVYCREFFFVKGMLERAEFGKLSFLKGEYYQDLEGDYPLYWKAQPPMHYATHALSPLLALADDEVRRVACFGSGTLKESIQQPGGNSFPIQTAIFKLANSDVAVQLNKSWFQIARAYTEAFSVYGEKRGFEWPQLEDEDPIVFELDALDPQVRWRNAKATRVKVPFRPDLLPAEISKYGDGGHGGSHPHLVHEFVSSIVEDREPYPNAMKAAQWTAAGICADLSSRQDGVVVEVASYGWES